METDSLQLMIGAPSSRQSAVRRSAIGRSAIANRQSPIDTCLDDGCQAITSLSRAVADGAPLADVGSLLWVLLGQMVPCHAMALFTLDAPGGQVAVRFAAGVHARALHGVTRPVASGIAGWVALNRRPVLNAEPVFDLGVRGPASRALRSSVVVPLVDNGTVVFVLALYSKDLLAFTDEHVSLLELLGPRLAVALAAATGALGDDRQLEKSPGAAAGGILSTVTSAIVS